MMFIAFVSLMLMGWVVMKGNNRQFLQNQIASSLIQDAPAVLPEPVQPTFEDRLQNMMKYNLLDTMEDYWLNKWTKFREACTLGRKSSEIFI